MALYYIQINIICIIILVGMDSLIHNKREAIPARRLVFSRLVRITMVMCLSDIFAWTGNSLPAARFVLHVSNMLYYASITWVGYVWSLYVYMRITGTDGNLKRFMFLSAIPVLVMSLIILINPWTNFLYTISDANEYSRGPGVIVHWIITWGYLLAATVQTVYSILKAKTKTERAQYLSLVWFIVLPVIAAGCQMFFYGVSATQCGITLSIVMVMSGYLQEKISRDVLTGLNNRGALISYLTEQLQHTEQEIFIFMLDIDNFKKINDTYGHAAGDKALKLVADVLKRSVAKSSVPLFLCRYGGDEFVIAGRNLTDQHVQTILQDINSTLKEVNFDYEIRSTIGVSIGVSNGVCASYGEMESLLEKADEAMYEDKQKKKVQRG